MTNIIDTMIGRQILLRRLEAEISQADLARRLLLTTPVLDAFESGQQRVTNIVLKKLAGELGVPLSYFFDWATPPEHGAMSSSSGLSPLHEAIGQKS